MQALFKFHRYFGLFAAVFVVTLAITGIMLNHTDRLRLDDQAVQQGWLLSLYGIAEPEQGPAFKVGDHWLVQSGKEVYLNETPLPGSAQLALRGGVWQGDVVIVGFEDKLALYSEQGQLIDTLSWDDGADTQLEALGITDEHQVLAKTAADLYQVDPDFTELTPAHIPPTDIHWSQPDPIPASIEQLLKDHYRGAGLTLERVILDLHSGRLIGFAGVLLMDAAAVLMLVLTLSGIGIWVTRVRRQSRRRTSKT